MMTKEISDKCSSCTTTIVTKSQQTPFRLPFEAKIIASLVLFATTISVYRTSTLLRYFDAYYAGRSLQADQSSSTKLRVRLQKTWSTVPRVVFLDENADWIFHQQNSATLHRSIVKIFDPIDMEGNDDTDEDLANDPTRRYDNNDSADLPTLERPNWPNHEFDPHCRPAASWQTTFHPTCNEIHSGADLKQVLTDGDFTMLSSKGYWRHAWLHHPKKNDMPYFSSPTSKAVWKMLK